MQKVDTSSGYKLIFLLMISVFFTLNAKYLNFPGSHILRWVFPILLILFSVIRNYGKISPPPALLFFFIIAVAPSVYLSINLNKSIQKAIAFVLIFYGSYIFLTGLNSTKSMEKCFILSSYVAIFFQIINLIFIFLGMGSEGGRATGITTNANTLGVYSSLAFCSSLYLATKNRNKFIKIFFTFLAISAVYTALASGSRSAFVVIVLNVIIVVIIKYYKSFMIVPILIVTVVLTYLLLEGKLAFLNISALDRFADQGTTRGELWDLGISAWKRSPIYGCGYTVSNEINLLVKGMQFHNSYLSFLIECGVWGVVFLGLGLIGFFIKLLANIKHCSDNFSLGVFFFACLIVFDLALCAYGESFLFAVGSTEGFIFWFLIAWILAYIKQRKCEEE